jgi:predicted metal-binding protein
MMDKALLEEQLSQLPLYSYAWIDPRQLEFNQRIRWICEHECPMYGKTWACPPGVGTVEHCAGKCRSFENCLMIATITEVEDIADIQQTLATRPEHEEVTNQVGAFLEEQGVKPYILSTEACAICQRCAIEDGQPCRHPDKMHPCVESHGINIIPVLEEQGICFQYGENVVTWISLLFY